jgi:hypothetical protein
MNKPIGNIPSQGLMLSRISRSINCVSSVRFCVFRALASLVSLTAVNPLLKVVLEMINRSSAMPPNSPAPIDNHLRPAVAKHNDLPTTSETPPY